MTDGEVDEIIDLLVAELTQSGLEQIADLVRRSAARDDADELGISRTPTERLQGAVATFKGMTIDPLFVEQGLVEEFGRRNVKVEVWPPDEHFVGGQAVQTETYRPRTRDLARLGDAWLEFARLVGQ